MRYKVTYLKSLEKTKQYKCKESYIKAHKNKIV